jgi:hypothetical protein
MAGISYDWYDCLAYWWMHMYGILVDAHGWHIGRCTCWHMVDTFHGWMISFGTLLMYMVDVHGCCAWWAHFGT